MTTTSLRPSHGDIMDRTRSGMLLAGGDYSFKGRGGTTFEDRAEPDWTSEMFGARIPETAARGKALFWEGAPAEHIFQIVEGVVRLFRIFPDGRRVVMGFAFPGDVLGIAVKDRYLFTAEAVTPVRMRRASRERLSAQLAEQPQVAAIIFDRMRDELCAVQDQMLLLLCQAAETRIVKFQVRVARKSPGAIEHGEEFELPMLRTDIADHLGLTMETVCRTMTKLRRDGLIAMRGPHKIQIRNARRLLEAAGREETDDADEAWG